MGLFPQPTRRTALQLLLTLWQITRTGAQVFVWGSLRAGAVGLRAYGRALQLLTLVGLGLIGLFLAGLLFSDALRFNAPLALLANDSSAVRGLLAPSAALPITLAAVTLGWGYVLAGALHTRPALRWATFGVYMWFGVLPLGPQLAPALAGWLALALPLVLVGLLVAFLVLPRVQLPLAVEWCVVLGLHGLLVTAALSATVRYELLTDEAWVANMVSSLTQTHYLFTTPFLVIAGLGWADFGIEASGWAAGAVRRHAAAWVVTLLLLALLVARLAGVVIPLIRDGLAPDQPAAFGGAGLLCAGLLAVALWRLRRPPDQLPARLLPTLAILLPAGSLLVLLALQASSVALLFQEFSPRVGEQVTQVNQALLRLNDLEWRYRGLVFALIGLAVALIGRRRGNSTVVAFGLLLAWSQALAWLTRDGNPLEALQFEYRHVDALLLLGMFGLSLFWLARGALSGERALRLLALAVLLGLLNQTDFLDNPLSPLFAFAGVLFLVFGIIWNILTAAGGFLQHDSPGFPRDSRLLMYLGYVLLSVSVAHWYLASHNLQMQINQSNVNQLGFVVLGLPLAYLMVAERGEPLVAGETLEAEG